MPNALACAFPHVARAAAELPRTAALRRALDELRDPRSIEDLLFLEAWELEPAPGSPAALRVAQIRRANPLLVAEIRAELARGRPLTRAERAVLAARYDIAA